MSFHVYMLRCSDRALYAGHTDDLESRVQAHQDGSIQGFTSSRRPIALVWSQEFGARLEAIQAERQIKGWSRAKKLALIKSDWKEIQLLALRHSKPSEPSDTKGATDC